MINVMVVRRTLRRPMDHGGFPLPLTSCCPVWKMSNTNVPLFLSLCHDTTQRNRRYCNHVHHRNRRLLRTDYNLGNIPDPCFGVRFSSSSSRSSFSIGVNNNNNNNNNNSNNSHEAATSDDIILDGGDSSSNHIVSVTNNGRTVSITTSINADHHQQHVKHFAAPLLWVNDPKYIHPSSGQRLRTLGHYSSSNTIVDATIIVIVTTSTAKVTSDVTVGENSQIEGDTTSGCDFRHLHPPPLPNSLHPRGGIYTYHTNNNNNNNNTDVETEKIKREMLKLQWEDGEETYFDLRWLLEGHNCEESSSSTSSPSEAATAVASDTTRVTKDIAIRSCSVHTPSVQSGTSTNDNICEIGRNRDNTSISTFEYRKVMDDDAALLQAMQEIFERGAILVKDGPIVLIHNDDHNTVKDAERHYRQQQEQESVVGDLGKRFSGGALSHGSLYGDIFHVQTKDNAENIAYTNVPLPPHQDLTYYESKPFLQLLHCVNNTEGEGIGHAQQSKATIESRIEGGESILIDAMAAAEELKLLAPDLFDVLCRREAIFLKEREGAGMISPKPHIVCDPTYGQVVEINWSPPFEGPLQLDPNIPVDLYVRAYQAMECISTSPDPNTKGSATRIGMLLPTDLRKKLQDYAVQYTWQYELQRGDILVFNNQRMLHGRRGFVSVGNGQRHLIGCYTESDATLSRYRQLLRDSSHHNSFDNGPDSVSSHAKLGYGRRNAGNGCRWM